MKNLLLLLSVIFFCSNAITAQNTEKAKASKFTVHSDVASLGLAHSFSFNAEGHLLTSKSENVNLYGSVGYAHVVIDFFGKDYYNGVNTALVVLVGKNNHHFETNIGLYTAIEFDRNNEFQRRYPIFFPILNLGYRYQKPKSDLFFRAKIGTMGIGVGVGYAF